MAGIDDIFNGAFFDAMLSPFITANFPAEIFYLFFLALALALIYIKTKSLGLVSLTLIMVSGALMGQVEPTIQRYFQGLLFFGVVSLIYSLFKGK